MVELCLAELAGQHAHTAAVVANRCDPAELDAVAAALRASSPTACSATCCPRSRCWSRRRWPSCGMRYAATVISGDEDLLSREALGVLVAGMTAEHVLERLTEGMAVITPGDRSDVVLAMASAHAAAGLSVAVLPHPQRRAAAAPVDRGAGGRACGLRLPIVATDLGTYDTARAVAQARGRVTATSQRKIDTALELMDSLRRHRGSHCAAVDSDSRRWSRRRCSPTSCWTGRGRTASASCCPRATTTAS